MADMEYDAIVVGSGISGGWAAKELTEKGLKVLMLERGPNVEHIKDYPNNLTQRWEFPHRGTRTRDMEEQYPVLKRDYPLNEMNLDWWASDQDCPYTEVKRFDWFRGYHVGGRSLTWGRQSYRLSDLDFAANAKEGIAIDWPVRYAEIAPWYDYVERFSGISGNRDGIDHLPDAESLLPPMDLNCVEKDVAARIKKLYKGKRHLIIGRVANLSAAVEGRAPCQYRNKCWLGCPFGAYFSSQSSTLPAAMKTGNLTLRPDSIVTQVLYDKDRQRATGVEVLDAGTNQTYTYQAKVVFLNASTINSTWILMNSATDIWPDGLGSSSGELGHNLMDHHLGVRAAGFIDGYEDKYYYGRRPTGFYVPRFRNLSGEKRNYLRGFGYQGRASREDWRRDIAEYSIGLELKEALMEPGRWSIGMGGFGEILPYHENHIRLDKSRTDKWGLNVVAIDCELKENELNMRQDMLNDAMEMFEAVGAKEVTGHIGDGTPGRGIHEMGTARMGHDPKTSVLNKWNQVWDAPNVFVTDGSFMTSAACQNPSLTYMAFTARAVDHAIKELNKQNL